MFHRPRSKVDPDISPLERLLDVQIKDLRKTDRAMEGIAAAWDESMPPGMSPTFDRIAGRGVLIVKLGNASHRFLASRALRSGAERIIVAASKGKVRSVKLEA